LKRNNAISIYGTTKQIVTQPNYSYAQRKRINYTRNGKDISYLRKTGKTIIVKEHNLELKQSTSRFTIYGTAEDCKKAKELIEKQGYVPKQKSIVGKETFKTGKRESNHYQDNISARTYTDLKGHKHIGFLDKPEQYARRDKWVKEQKIKDSP
jgi:hypothetical protein